MNQRVSGWAGMTAAAMLAFGFQVAQAQPAGGMIGQGPGPGPGHGNGLAIEEVLASLKGQLGLDTSQQLMWDNVVAQAKAARRTGRDAMVTVHGALNDELAKAEPDFAVVAKVADAAMTDQQTLRKQVRDEWLKVYATFTPTQKGVVRDAVKARVARMEAFREKMLERMQSRSKASGG